MFRTETDKKPLPIEKIDTLCVKNGALFIVKLWNINIMSRFLSLIFTQFVPGIYLVLQYTFRVLETMLYCRIRPFMQGGLFQ